MPAAASWRSAIAGGLGVMALLVSPDLALAQTSPPSSEPSAPPAAAAPDPAAAQSPLPPSPPVPAPLPPSSPAASAPPPPPATATVTPLAPAAMSPAPPPPSIADAGTHSRRPRLGLLAAGVATFVASYAATIGVNYAVCTEPATWRGCDSKGLAFIPVFGSMILAGTPNTEMSYRALAVPLGLTQALGLVLVGVSFTATSGEKSRATYLLPFVNRDGGGATVAGHF